MLTSAECRANAEQKLTEAEPDCDKRQQMRLIEAAQAWLILASQIRRIEASLRRLPKVTVRQPFRHFPVCHPAVSELADNAEVDGATFGKNCASTL
jgi:hypothetical protein